MGFYGILSFHYIRFNVVDNKNKRPVVAWNISANIGKDISTLRWATLGILVSNGCPLFSIFFYLFLLLVPFPIDSIASTSTATDSIQHSISEKNGPLQAQGVLDAFCTSSSSGIGCDLLGTPKRAHLHRPMETNEVEITNGWGLSHRWVVETAVLVGWNRQWWWYQW